METCRALEPWPDHVPAFLEQLHLDSLLRRVLEDVGESLDDHVTK